eukprot:TRINITY_DN12301_c0_g1_i1.p1 TRINITY_DN12301_c0_g1~~TRINITY_DN12301_c0_g1_i1.p1  ORF type:complete len:444 (+),score=152.97 TRINITY_DN12301_c0_g1_i1:57-1334(+)
MVELRETFAGTTYIFRLDSDALSLLDDCKKGKGDADAMIPVTYVGEDGEDEGEDEVDAGWLACVQGDFEACRGILDRAGAGDEVLTAVMELAQKAARQGDADLLEAMRTRLAAQEGRMWLVDTEALMGDCNDQHGVVEFCLDLGFRGDSFNACVPPSSHKLALAACRATSHLEAPHTTEALCEDTCLSGADMHLLRAALAAPGPIADAFEKRAALGAPLHYIGHLLASPLSDESLSVVIESVPFWEYMSDRNVPKVERMVAVGGNKSVTYTCRVDRLRRELYPTWSAPIKDLCVKTLQERYEAEPPVDTGIMCDPVTDALSVLVVTHGDGAEDDADAPEETPEKKFEAAVERSRLFGDLSNDEKLVLYSLYKQATEGDCTKPKPGMFDFQGKAKWQAWTSRQGMETDAAMAQYTEAVKDLASAGK